MGAAIDSGRGSPGAKLANAKCEGVVVPSNEEQVGGSSGPFTTRTRMCVCVYVYTYTHINCI